MESDTGSERNILQSARASRRTLLRGTVGLGLVSLFAACGGDDDDDEGSTPAPTATEADSGQEDDDAEPTATEESESSGDGEMREVEDGYGEMITIPANPQRIVVTDNIALPYVLELGVIPVASGTLNSEYYDGRDFPEALYDLGAGDVEPFSRDEPDIEFVAMMEPDLFIGSTFALESRIAGGAEQFKALAPLVAVNDSEPIFDQLRHYGRILNREERAEEIIADFEAAITGLATDVTVQSVSMARAYSDGQIFVYTPEDAATSLWADLVGVDFLPESDDVSPAGTVIMSGERMNELSGEVLITLGGLDPEGLQSNPLWDLIPAVQAGQVYDAGDYLVYHATYGLTALREQIVGIVEYLASLGEGSGTGTGSAAYPVTIDHKYGSTTIEETPERIVLVGLVEQDALLAMGVVPVATREWYGGRPGAIFPWAEDLLDGADVPVVLDSVELDFEQITSLQPDVIVGLYAGITQQEYDILSQIAPTVAQPAEYVDWGIPWQELTLTLGDIIGQRAAAESLVDDVESTFEAAREENPEFAGMSGLVASPWGLPENYWAYASQDVRGRILTSLGFEVPEAFDELAGDGFGAEVSVEEFGLLADLDLLIWVSTPDALEGVELYNALPVVQEGRVLFYGDGNPVYDAINFGTVLSLPYAVENLVPDIVLAVDGDPDTNPEG